MMLPRFALASLLLVASTEYSRSDPAVSRPMTGACELQLQVRGEWTTPRACEITTSAAGDLVLVALDGDYTIQGTIAGDATAWELAGTLRCPLDDCPATFTAKMRLGDPDHYSGRIALPGGDIPIEVRRTGATPRAASKTVPLPSTSIAPLAAPVMDGAFEYRLLLDGQWSGTDRATMSVGKGGAITIDAVQGLFIEGLTAKLKVKGGKLVGTVAVIDSDTGKTRHARLRLAPTSDGAWTGMIPLDRKVKIELRPIVDGSLADLVGPRTCRVKHGKQWGTPFRCDIEGTDDAGISQDLDSASLESIAGMVVRTPSGFRVWGEFQYDCGGDSGCGGYGPTEFVATDTGWLGRLVLGKSTIVILMQP
jgi:hypothetical protein